MVINWVFGSIVDDINGLYVGFAFGFVIGLMIGCIVGDVVRSSIEYNVGWLVGSLFSVCWIEWWSSRIYCKNIFRDGFVVGLKKNL